MGARDAVLLIPSESSGPVQLLSFKQLVPVNPLECALLEVFILKSFKFFRMNTYEKHRGWGLLLLTRHATKHVYPERPSGVAGPLLPSDEDSCAQRVRSLLLCLAPLQSLRFRQGEE